MPEVPGLPAGLAASVTEHTHDALNAAAAAAALAAGATAASTAAGTNLPALLELDLSSTVRNIPASIVLGSGSPVTIQQGDAPHTINVTDLLTPAQLVAVQQVLSEGQSLNLSSLGTAIGGSLVTSSQLTEQAISLFIPSGVSAFHDFGVTESLVLSGNFSNAGSFYGYSSDAQSGTALISALNIVNHPGALISTALPDSFSGGVYSSIANLSLSLNAVESILNAGTIFSSGNLTAVAGNSIVNAAPAGTGAVMQAQQNLAMLAPSVVNQGQISSLLGNINTTTASLNNSLGTLNALAGSVSIASLAGGNLSIANALGSIAARDQVTLAAVADSVAMNLVKQNLEISGGRLSGASGVGFDAGEGHLKIAVDDVVGPVDVHAGTAQISVTSGSQGMFVRSMEITGDPDFTYIGNGPFFSPDITTWGGNVLIDTSFDTNAGSIEIQGTVNTAPLDAGNAGQIVMHAGTTILAGDLKANANQEGSGGFILLTAPQGVKVFGVVESLGAGSGAGGDVTLQSNEGSVEVTDTIRSNGTAGKTVSLFAGVDIKVKDVDSSATVAGQTGNAGVIGLSAQNTITAGNLRASSIHDGSGGQIIALAPQGINVNGSVESLGSQSGYGSSVSLESQSGPVEVSGRIRTNLNGGLAVRLISGGDVKAADIDTSADPRAYLESQGGGVLLRAGRSVTAGTLNLAGQLDGQQGGAVSRNLNGDLAIEAGTSETAGVLLGNTVARNVSIQGSGDIRVGKIDAVDVGIETTHDDLLGAGGVTIGGHIHTLNSVGINSYADVLTTSTFNNRISAPHVSLVSRGGSLGEDDTFSGRLGVVPGSLSAQTYSQTGGIFLNLFSDAPITITGLGTSGDIGLFILNSQGNNHDAPVIPVTFTGGVAASSAAIRGASAFISYRTGWNIANQLTLGDLVGTTPQGTNRIAGIARDSLGSANATLSADFIDIRSNGTVGYATDALNLSARDIDLQSINEGVYVFNHGSTKVSGSAATMFSASASGDLHVDGVTGGDVSLSATFWSNMVIESGGVTAVPGANGTGTVLLESAGSISRVSPPVGMPAAGLIRGPREVHLRSQTGSLGPREDGHAELFVDTDNLFFHAPAKVDILLGTQGQTNLGSLGQAGTQLYAGELMLEALGGTLTVVDPVATGSGTIVTAGDLQLDNLVSSPGRLHILSSGDVMGQQGIDPHLSAGQLIIEASNIGAAGNSLAIAGPFSVVALGNAFFQNTRNPAFLQNMRVGAILAGGDVELASTTHISLEGAMTAGSFHVYGHDSVSVGASLNATNGFAEVLSQSGVVSVNAGVNISASSGNVSLQSLGGDVVIGSFASIDAGGDVMLAAGGNSGQLTNEPPPNVVVTTVDLERVFFSTSGIGTSQPDNLVSASSGSTVTIDAREHALYLQGGVRINSGTSQTPCPDCADPLSSLNLANSADVEAVLLRQSENIFGGQLLVSPENIAIGGNVIIPASMISSLSALVIPANVGAVVTSEVSDSTISVSLNEVSSDPVVTISGSLDFAGGANSFLSISSTHSHIDPLALLVTGMVSSDAGLWLNVAGEIALSNSGSIATTGPLQIDSTHLVNGGAIVSGETVTININGGTLANTGLIQSNMQGPAGTTILVRGLPSLVIAGIGGVLSPGAGNEVTVLATNSIFAAGANALQNINSGNVFRMDAPLLSLGANTRFQTLAPETELHIGTDSVTVPGSESPATFATAGGAIRFPGRLLVTFSGSTPGMPSSLQFEGGLLQIAGIDLADSVSITSQREIFLGAGEGTSVTFGADSSFVSHDGMSIYTPVVNFGARSNVVAGRLLQVFNNLGSLTVNLPDQGSPATVSSSGQDRVLFGNDGLGQPGGTVSFRADSSGTGGLSLGTGPLGHWIQGSAIDIESGVTLVSQESLLLRGSSLTVDTNAVIDVASGGMFLDLPAVTNHGSLTATGQAIASHPLGVSVQGTGSLHASAGINLQGPEVSVSQGSISGTITGASLGGDFAVDQSTGIMKVGNLSANGSITMTLGAGSIEIEPGAMVSATGGDIVMHVVNAEGSAIVVGANASVSADYAGVSSGGNVLFSVGTLPDPPIVGQQPANVMVNIENGGQVYWGDGTINTEQPTITITSSGGRITLNGGSFLTIGGGAVITSTGPGGGPAPCTCLDSLDFTNPRDIQIALDLIRDNHLVGTLREEGGVAVGSLRLDAGNPCLAPEFKALRVTPDMELALLGYDESFPFSIRIEESYHDGEVRALVQGEQFFTGNGTMNVSSSFGFLPVPVLVIEAGGTLGADGLLTVSANGGIEVNGPITAMGGDLMLASIGNNGSISLAADVSGGPSTTLSAHGSGNISRTAGSVSSTGTVSLRSESGEIGAEGQSIRVAAENVLASTTGSAFLAASTPITVLATTLGGTFGLDADDRVFSEAIHAPDGIKVNALGFVEYKAGADISTTPTDGAAVDGGPVTITAGKFIKLQNVTTRAKLGSNGSGGDVSLSAADDIEARSIGTLGLQAGSVIVNAGGKARLGGPINAGRVDVTAGTDVNIDGMISGTRVAMTTKVDGGGTIFVSQPVVASETLDLVGDKSVDIMGKLEATGEIRLTARQQSVFVDAPIQGQSGVVIGANRSILSSVQSTISADRLTLRATTGNIGLPDGGFLDTQTNILQAEARAPGRSIFIQERDSIKLEGIRADDTASVKLLDGSIDIADTVSANKVVLAAFHSITQSNQNVRVAGLNEVKLEAQHGLIGSLANGVPIRTQGASLSIKADGVSGSALIDHFGDTNVGTSTTSGEFSITVSGDATVGGQVAAHVFGMTSAKSIELSNSISAVEEALLTADQSITRDANSPGATIFASKFISLRATNGSVGTAESNIVTSPQLAGGNQALMLGLSVNAPKGSAFVRHRGPSPAVELTSGRADNRLQIVVESGPITVGRNLPTAREFVIQTLDHNNGTIFLSAGGTVEGTQSLELISAGGILPSGGTGTVSGPLVVLSSSGGNIGQQADLPLGVRAGQLIVRARSAQNDGSAFINHSDYVPQGGLGAKTLEIVSATAEKNLLIQTSDSKVVVNGPVEADLTEIVIQAKQNLELLADVKGFSKVLLQTKGSIVQGRGTVGGNLVELVVSEQGNIIGPVQGIALRTLAENLKITARGGPNDGLAFISQDDALNLLSSEATRLDVHVTADDLTTVFENGGMIKAKDIFLRASSGSVILDGQIKADDRLSVVASDSIRQTNANVRAQALKADLTATTGTIGTEQNFIKLSVDSVVPKAPANQRDIYIHNDKKVGIGPAEAGGRLVLTASGDIDVTDGITAGSISLLAQGALAVAADVRSTSGDVLLRADGESLYLLPAFTIAAVDGSVTLQNVGGNIVLGSDAVVDATRGAYDGAVNIFLGESARPGEELIVYHELGSEQLRNLRVRVANDGQIFLSDRGVIGVPTLNRINANGATVTLDAGTSGGTIELQGNVRINKNLAPRPIDNLDFTHSLAVSEIVNQIAEGDIMGDLQVDSGVATSGTVTFLPANLAPTLVAQNIPEGVEVTMDGFSASPLEIILDSSSSTPRVIIAGTQRFVSGDGSVHMSSSNPGPVLVVSGQLHGDGALSITANGAVEITGSGTITSGGALEMSMLSSGAGGSAPILLTMTGNPNLQSGSDMTVSAGGGIHAQGTIRAGGDILIQTAGGGLVSEATIDASGDLTILASTSEQEGGDSSSDAQPALAAGEEASALADVTEQSETDIVIAGPMKGANIVLSSTEGRVNVGNVVDASGFLTVSADKSIESLPPGMLKGANVTLTSINGSIGRKTADADNPLKVETGDLSVIAGQSATISATGSGPLLLGPVAVTKDFALTAEERDIQVVSRIDAENVSLRAIDDGRAVFIGADIKATKDVTIRANFAVELLSQSSGLISAEHAGLNAENNVGTEERPLLTDVKSILVGLPLSQDVSKEVWIEQKNRPVSIVSLLAVDKVVFTADSHIEIDPRSPLLGPAVRANQVTLTSTGGNIVMDAQVNGAQSTSVSAAGSITSSNGDFDHINSQKTYLSSANGDIGPLNLQTSQVFVTATGQGQGNVTIKTRGHLVLGDALDTAAPLTVKGALNVTTEFVGELGGGIHVTNPVNAGSVKLVADENIRIRKTISADTRVELRAKESIVAVAVTPKHISVPTGTLALTATNGAIGSKNEPLRADARTIEKPTAKGDAVIETKKDPDLTGASVGGALSLTSDELINVVGNLDAADVRLQSSMQVTVQADITARAGSIAVIAGEGMLDVFSGVSLRANAGNLILQNSDGQEGSIRIGAGASLVALSGAPSTDEGNVRIFIGSDFALIPGSPPPSDAVVTSISSGGAIYFGTNGISAVPPASTISANGGTVVFDTGGRPADAISLGGGVVIAASFPAQERLAALDLSDKDLVSSIIAMQGLGLLGGRLELTANAVTGTLSLEPAHLNPSLSGLIVPEGVTLTLKNFSSDAPINVDLSDSGKRSQVTISGTLEFQNTAIDEKGVITVFSSRANPMLVISESGRVMGSEHIELRSDGDLKIDGPVTASRITLATIDDRSDIRVGADVIGSQMVSMTALGNIQDFGGTISAPSVSLSSEFGSLGTNRSKLSTSTGELNLLTLGKGSAFVANSGAVDLRSASVGGNLVLIAEGTMHIGGDVTAKNTSLEVAGTGSILQSAGTVFGQDVVLSVDNGSIGELSNPLITSATTLSLSAGGSGGVFIRESDGVALDPVATNGSFNLSAGGDLLVRSLSTQNGSISLISRSGELKVTANSDVVANEGNLLLQAADIAGGSIETGKNVLLKAFTVADPQLGHVTIVVGAVPESPVPGVTPGNVVVSEVGGGKVYFGTGGITASKPQSTIEAIERNVVFETNGAPASSIRLGGKTSIVADPPRAPGIFVPGDSWQNLPDDGGSPEPSSGLNSSTREGGLASRPDSSPLKPADDFLATGTAPVPSGDQAGVAGWIAQPSAGISLPGGGESFRMAGSQPDLLRHPSAARGNDNQEHSLNQEKEESLRPIKFVSPSVMASGGSGEVVSVRTATSSIKHTGGVELSIEHTGVHNLRAGETLVAASGDSTVKSEMVTISLRKGTIALISVEGNTIKIRNLWETRSGALRVYAKTSHLDVPAGHEAVLSNDRSALETALAQDGVGRRRSQTWSMEQDRVCSRAEISLVSLMQSSGILASMSRSRSASDRAIMRKVVKMAACLMQVTSAHGPYSQQPRAIQDRPGEPAEEKLPASTVASLRMRVPEEANLGRATSAKSAATSSTRKTDRLLKAHAGAMLP